MKVLVTGGAGYIGSHVVKALGQAGFEIVVIDNLSTGHEKALLFGKLYIGDLSDEDFVESVFKTEKIEAILHFAGSIVVPESVKNPVKYYQNNTNNSLKLLAMAEKYQVKKFIFSSTAAVYGSGSGKPCIETQELSPINPYGSSKLMTEVMLKDLSLSSDFRYVALRYFNVSGADPEGEIGQSFPGATHLIKVASETACGKREQMEIFGSDYPTKDGSCVRDYIHVSDLASAHVEALRYLNQGGSSDVFNCGYGQGFSVFEVIKVVKDVTGVDFKVITSPRRAGDPAELISNVDKINKILPQWKPKYQDLSYIVKTAYEWERKRTY